jgi:sterol desaturase/sphingolipid hydroxylase (fatty acid hydroxylase superfamily)
MIAALGSAAYALAWLAAIFLPLEWARPRWPGQARLRRGVATDLAFFAGQHLLFGAAVAWLLSHAIALVPRPDGLTSLQARFANHPGWLRALVVLVLGDLAMYWGHRLQHRVPWLWRFHAVHHSAEQLDFLAAHREHPLDGLYTQLWMNLPALALGFSFEGLLGLVAFRGLWATLIHANVQLPLGPLAWLVGSPQHHHVHHQRERDVGNYANLAPWIDRLFGTHREAPEGPLELGLDEPAPSTYLGLLVQPFTATRSPRPPRERAGAVHPGLPSAHAACGLGPRPRA